MTLPTFLVIGAQKAGTTSLYLYLKQHPQVFMSRLKEPDFFVAERGWGRGLEWYESLFRSADGIEAVGEASTAYSMYPRYQDVPRRISQVLPDVRLIYLVRDPIERIRSDYLHHVYPPPRARSMTPERRPIHEALVADRSFIEASCYAMQIEQYLEHFPRDRLLVIASEDLKERRYATVRRVCAFVGVDQEWTSPVLGEEYNRTARGSRALDRKIRQSRPARKIAAAAPRAIKRLGATVLTKRIDPAGAFISDELRRSLEDQLRDDVRRLREYLGEDFDGWGIA